MPDAILVLQLDHRKLSKVLDLIQQQVTNLVRRNPVNYRLLESTFDYLSGYPEQCHHPKEDVVYKKLLSRYPEMAESLRDLEDEHVKLSDQTRRLRQAIRDSRTDPPAMNDAVADQLSAFLDSYRLHIHMEEEHFFPLALERLSRTDFAEIDFTLFDQVDPLFNREAEARFAELRNEIARLASADQTSAVDRDDLACLTAFWDIAAFNQEMRQRGEPVCLTRAPTGGYELDWQGEVLARIPACSEPRAAWCAWFFWKATNLAAKAS